MDHSAESTPSKKICISENVNDMQLKECVPQQLPNAIKQMDTTSWKLLQMDTTKWKFKKEKLSPPKLTNFGSHIVSNGEYQVLNKSHKLETVNKLQKLRILSPKGRDLGEFNVELQANNPLKGKTVKIIKSSVEKVPIISLSNKKLPLVCKQNTPKISQINLVPNSDSTCHKTVITGENKILTSILTSPPQHCVNLPRNEILTNSCTAEIDKEKQLRNSVITYCESDKASTSGINLKNSVCDNNDITNNNEQNHSEINNKNNYLKIKEVTPKNSEVSTDAKIPIHAEVNKSQFLLVNCKKQEINSSNEQYGHFKTGKECIAVIKKTKDGKIITSLKNVRKIDNLNQDNLDNNKKRFYNEKVSDNKNNLFQIKSKLDNTNNQVHEVKTQQNVMTVIPNNEKCVDQNAVLSQHECDAAVSSASTMTIDDKKKIKQDTKRDKLRTKRISQKIFTDCLNATVDNHTCNSEIQHVADISNTNVQSNLQNKTYQKDYHVDLSNQYDIIQKAMDSVKDNELRELAMKALMDCGIGIQRYIPVHSLEQHKSVCDTQVQTEVFGLLDPKSFILISKDIDNINRINQINLQDISDSQNLLSTNDLYSHVDSTSKISEQDIFNVNFWKYFEENLDVTKIETTLSAAMKKYRNLVDHLQKDFESVKQYDQNGMLNIHNAVISNNIHLVQRQLMILKYCKESVDILTKDELTSLELAIKYDIRSEIVKLLLEAGAQPVIPKCIRESALIIASKQSSPLLPMLIKYISDFKLLDLIDSEGLAALHYCSMHGNLEGVNAILSAGGNIDLKDKKSGRTPLFHAIDNNHTVIAQALLKAGAVANIANYAGQTPLPIMTDTKCAPFRISMYTDTL
ncbi:putative leucine-rich repeat-containing protein DDB_G0290503 [Linepithema humile]|uniref:putative leucine-rich repeat-containing protein DDB_G0290503 n=1 Tax=Linepithema humile TaxID=83485 RepID=UPI00351DB709